jgi:hypothetical protein
MIHDASDILGGTMQVKPEPDALRIWGASGSPNGYVETIHMLA